MTANLHRITVRQAAQIMNVSERTVFMARELMACARPDLARAVENGRLSLHAALAAVKPSKYGKKPDRLTVLLKAWEAANKAEKSAFLAKVLEDGR